MAHPIQDIASEVTPIGQSETANKKSIIAIAGGKGGVGKTILTFILGACLAENGKKTVLIDLDFGGANLHQALGIITPPCSLGNFINKTNSDLASLKLETFLPNLSFIAGAAGTLCSSHVLYWIKQKVFRNIQTIDADYILLDVGAGNSFNQLDYYNFADSGVIVVTPEPLAIQDAYNFIKVALFRKITIEMAQFPIIREYFKKYISKSPRYTTPSMQEVFDLVTKHGGIALQVLKETIQSFQPSIIFNMLETSNDYYESYSLQIAIKEILNVYPKYVGYVRYDDIIRKAAKQLRPDLMIAKNVNVANDVRQIVRESLLSEKIARENNPTNFVAQRTYKTCSDETNEIVCSIQCQLWGNCSMQNGGLLCRIPVIGFVNQKKAGKY